MIWKHCFCFHTYLQVSHMSTRHWVFPENFSVSTQKLIISSLHTMVIMFPLTCMGMSTSFPIVYFGLMCDFFWLCEKKKGWGGQKTLSTHSALVSCLLYGKSLNCDLSFDKIPNTIVWNATPHCFTSFLTSSTHAISTKKGQVWVHHFIKPAVPDFHYCSCVIWHTSGFLSCFPSLRMAWQLPFWWDHFIFWLKAQMQFSGPVRGLWESFLFLKDRTFGYCSSAVDIFF